MKTLLSSAATLVVLTTAALAADLPVRSAPPVFVPPPAAVFTWTGLYIGLQAGYEFGRDHSVYSSPYTDINNVDGPVLAAETESYVSEVPVGFGSTYGDTRPNGVAGGGHVGYLFSTQSLPVFGGVLGGGGVIGVEGDVNGSNYRSSSSYYDGALVVGGVRSDIQASIRGRLGVAFDRVLVYATGGAAFATFDVTVPDSFGDPSRYTRDRLGYTVGGGVEYAISDNVSLRVEYRYSDYGTFTVTSSNGGYYDGSSSTHHETTNLVQGGVSYRFSNPVAPVVARY